MKILMLSWKDLKNPEKGGAEVVIDIYLNGLAKKGHEVTLFTKKYQGALDEENYNEYKIIRKGGKLSVYLHGFLYALKNRNKFDIFIDQICVIPFFTPLVISKKKKIAFFHQLTKEIWFYECKFPLALIGYILEWFYLKLYFNTKCICVSKSTEKDWRKYSLSKESIVLENNIDFKPIDKIIKKEKFFVFCGRLVRNKRVEDCIKAISQVKNFKLHIIGEGDRTYKHELANLISCLKLEKRVIFTGYIPLEERNKLMAKAFAILVTSVREGWGLIVTEANANGTLAITYNVPGLRDANKTGFICKNNNYFELADYMNKLINNKSLMLTLSKKSLEFSKGYCNWEKNITEFDKWLKKY